MKRYSIEIFVGLVIRENDGTLFNSRGLKFVFSRGLLGKSRVEVKRKENKRAWEWRKARPSISVSLYRQGHRAVDQYFTTV